MSTIISAAEAEKLIQTSQDLVILDCRGDLNDKEAGWRLYQTAHLPGALFLDGEKDLSAPVVEHGGRHPLPAIGSFSAKLEDCGLSNHSTVLAYGLYAPRLIMMLHLIGVTKTYLLDGDFAAWQQAGFPVTAEMNQPRPGRLVPEINQDLLVEMAEVKSKLANPLVRLIDSRAPERYRGDVEPLDRIPGHIPGAENYFWQQSFDEKGFLKSLEQLQDQVKSLNLKDQEEKILYCGSGITAAFNYLVFHNLGIKCRVYAGSYSDWVSYPDNPVNTLQK